MTNKPAKNKPALESVVAGQMLSEPQAAAWLSLSTRTLQNLRLNGGGPAFIKLSERRIAYDPSELRAWTQARTQRSTSTNHQGRAA